MPQMIPNPIHHLQMIVNRLCPHSSNRISPRRQPRIGSHLHQTSPCQIGKYQRTTALDSLSERLRQRTQVPLPQCRLRNPLSPMSPAITLDPTRIHISPHIQNTIALSRTIEPAFTSAIEIQTRGKFHRVQSIPSPLTDQGWQLSSIEIFRR
jgi:hypothetical protein